MTKQTLLLLKQLSDSYADRMNADEVEAVDEHLEDLEYIQAVMLLVSILTESKAKVTSFELEELEEVCENLDIELNILEKLFIV